MVVHEVAFIRALLYVIRSVPWIFFTAYLFTLSCLSVNQYLAVCMPWRYTTLTTHRRVTCILVCVWLISALHTIIPLLIICTVSMISQGRVDPMPVLHRLASVEILIWMLVFAAVIIFNICTLLVIYKKLCTLQLSNRTVCTSSLIKMPPSIRKKRETFVTLTCLLLASIFCRLPFPIIGIIGYSHATKIDYGTWEIINRSLAFLLYMNFLVDPVVYLVRMEDLRTGLRETCRWKIFSSKRRNNSGDLQGDDSILSQEAEEHEMNETHDVNDRVQSSTRMSFC